MDVSLGCCHGKFYITDTAQPQVLDRDFTVIDTAKFPDSGIGSQELLVVFNKIIQMNAAGLFLAFYDEFDITGKFAFSFQDRVDSLQAAGNIPFIVARSTRLQFPIPQGGFKGWAIPKFQRFSRLNVIMVIEEQG